MMNRPSDAQRAASSTHATLAWRTIPVIGRLLGYMRPYRMQLALVALFIILYNILNVIGPYLLGLAIDSYILAGDLPGLARIALLMAATYVGMWISGITYGRMMAKIAQRTLEAMREDLFNHLQTLSLNFYDRQSAGDLMSRLTNDIDAINQLLSQNLVTFFSSLFSLVGILIMMFVLNVWLALSALIVTPLMFFITARLMRRIGPAFQTLQKNLGALNGMMEENLSGQRVVIAYGQQGATLDAFESANEATRDAGITANIYAGIIPPLMMALSNLNVAVVVGIGSFLAVSGLGGVTIGLIATFVNYARNFGQPLMQIANLFSSITAALAGAERIFEVLDTLPDVADRANATTVSEIKGEVMMEEVDFSYLPGQPILKNISLTAQPGEMIALIGPTGAGKTTIVNVLTRFYDIEKGRILIDGAEIRDIRQDSLRQQVGMVLQDTYLFADTVKENIRYGRLEATDSEIIEAAKLANADGFIRRLPNGYDTQLSERASNLSQGQAQLLAIARAILANPHILILDEATSSVDTRTEVQIQQALLNLMDGRTSFVIAHRLSTIREADQILVLDAGEIVERGTHQALLAKKGFYYDLYTSQFKGTAVAV